MKIREELEKVDSVWNSCNAGKKKQLIIRYKHLYESGNCKVPWLEFVACALQIREVLCSTAKEL